MKKNPKKRLKNKADKLWYLKYLKDCCELCGESGVLQGHHFYYKSSYPMLRYCKDNHITLCKGCHFVLHHQDPKKIEEKIIAVRGKDWYNQLRKQSQKLESSFQTIGYYKKIIEELI